LLQLEGDAGAGKLIHQQRSLVGIVPFPQGEIDIDTPQDIANLQ
jgi:CTP:molybdopterin cytidylyltransferase MocA